MKILVINGPNINMLGQREPDVYGRQDYNALRAGLQDFARAHNITIDEYQSNIEGELVGWIHEARTAAVGIVINAKMMTVERTLFPPFDWTPTSWLI